jgi:ATP-dependent helicase/nuclease subunit A
MPFHLTPSQKRTLDLTSHLSVTANAGAGKTTVLARRFVQIFSATDAPLSSVVAVTFTEQAAAELRRKIHDVILGVEEDPSADPRTRARLLEVRNQLSSAVIGTIHSFCARILRMYPAEADIDASFSVLQGQERSRLVSESIAGSFGEILGGDAGAGEAVDFRELARMVPPARIESFLHKMLYRREQN